MSEISASTPASIQRVDGAVAQEASSIKNQQHPIGDGIAMMMYIMDLLSKFTSQKLDEMQKKADISRSAQDQANQVEAAMAKLINPEGKVELPPSVIEYMKANNILVEGKSIDEFLKSGGKLDKAGMMTVKAALESVSGRASDFVQQMQLKMQQLIQNYNTAVQMINSLQSMLAESNKGIASAIRQ